jgi:transcriptional regulator with XRE-family HTH domain
MPTEIRPGQVLPTRPTALSDPKAIVRYFRHQLGLTEAELSKVLGADIRSVRRWASDKQDAAPRSAHGERIDDLRDLVELLGETLPDEQIARWLRARNRLLGGERPLGVLAQRGYSRVREAAESFVDGDPI